MLIPMVLRMRMEATGTRGDTNARATRMAAQTVTICRLRMTIDYFELSISHGDNAIIIEKFLHLTFFSSFILMPTQMK